MVRFFDLLRGNSLPSSGPRRRRPVARGMAFETLEMRMMFAASAPSASFLLASSSDPAVATVSTLGTTSTASATTASVAAAAAQLVNNYNLNLAIQSGMSHLGNILDANNHLLPFFNVYALTKNQAKQYGDAALYRDSPAYMGFDQHLTSNVAGRALDALLAGADALGTSIDPTVFAAFESTVLKSLTKPRNGNWNDMSPANQMITGLAADPRSYGSQKFDVTYLFNMGAGMRGALGLATLTADPTAVLGGYLWSAEGLFETAVYNLRKYYVYGGGDIGGTRVYDWEKFRYQLGLQGGNQIKSTLSAELLSSWKGLYQGYADPFLIDDVVKYYQATGYQPALDLAKELRDYSFYQRFPLDPAKVPFGSFTHMFETVGEMNAYSRLALVTGDADMMNRVRVRYGALRGKGFSATGWSPEYYNSHSDVGEINNTAELIETALNFAQFGWTQYYDDVERFTRGMLLPSQLLNTSFVVPNANPANDGRRDIQNRVYGAFGFPAPYGAVSTLKPSSTGAYNTDVTGGAVATLADIKNADYHFAGGVHEIDLLFDINNDDISVASPYPAGDRVTIATKVAGDVRLRLPSWADRGAVAASLTQQGLQFEIQSNYVVIHNPAVGTAFYVAMPLAYQRQVDVVNGRQIVIDWLGDSVIAMSRMGTPMPFFPQATATPLSVAPATSPVVPGPPTATNLAPQVNAGPNQSIAWGPPVVLNGIARDDGLPTNPGTLSTSWTKISGPGDVIFADATAAHTTTQFSAAGTYVLRLAASDGQLSKTDDVTINVAGASTVVSTSFQDGVFPTVQYGGTRDTMLMSTTPDTNYGGVQKLTVDGSPDLSALFAWDTSSIQVGSVVTSALIELNVSNSSKQSYQLYALTRAWDELVASWNSANSGTAWSVKGAAGGADHAAASLGQLTAKKNGINQIALNQAGLAAVQAWINNPAANFGLILQNYSDSDGVEISSSEAPTDGHRPKLIVTYKLATNIPPLVYAGADQTISLGQSVTLGGSITVNGNPPAPGAISLLWTKVSGLGNVTFASRAATSTLAEFDAAGTYVLRLTVSDGKVTTFDDLTVLVQQPVQQVVS